jgi:hypothetical protein
MKTILANELLSHFGSEEHNWNDIERWLTAPM